jgi:hypothetical protein
MAWQQVPLGAATLGLPAVALFVILAGSLAGAVRRLLRIAAHLRGAR